VKFEGTVGVHYAGHALDRGGILPVRAAAPQGQAAGGEGADMDAVGALVDRGHADVAPSLLDPVLAQIAIAAENLEAEISGDDARLGAEDLAERGQELDQRRVAFPGQLHKGNLGEEAPAERAGLSFV